MAIANPPRQSLDDEMLIIDGKVWYRLHECYYCGRVDDEQICRGCGAPAGIPQPRMVYGGAWPSGKVSSV